MAEIEKIMTISSCHITENTANLLTQEPESDYLSLTVYNKAEYGWFIFVPEIIPNELPSELFNALWMAKRNDCKWLCIDCDGNEEKELQSFIW